MLGLCPEVTLGGSVYIFTPFYSILLYLTFNSFYKELPRLDYGIRILESASENLDFHVRYLIH